MDKAAVERGLSRFKVIDDHKGRLDRFIGNIDVRIGMGEVCLEIEVGNVGEGYEVILRNPAPEPGDAAAFVGEPLRGALRDMMRRKLYADVDIKWAEPLAQADDRFVAVLC